MYYLYCCAPAASPLVIIGLFCGTRTDLEILADNPRGSTDFWGAKSVEHRPPSKTELRQFKARGGDADSHVGCTFDGSLEVARAGGSIRVHVMHHDPARIIAMGGFVGMTKGEMRTGSRGVAGANITHKIHDFGFGPAMGLGNGGFGADGQSPLAGTVFVSEAGAGQARYSLKIVPISHVSIYGNEVKSHTYSSNVAFLTEDEAMKTLSTSQQWLGVDFEYDFTPIMVRYTETRKSALEFFTSVCAIVGGIYTVSGLLVQGVRGVSRKKND